MELSIAIVNYNTKIITNNCIKSILKNSKGLNYEIIIIDNASVDGSYDFLVKKYKNYKNIRIIKSKKNLGFAKANNKAAKIAKGRYLLFLNSDTIIENNIFGKIIDWMDKNNDVGIITCALKNNDGTLQGSGGFFPTLFRVFCWMFFVEDIPLLDLYIKPFHPVHKKSFFYKGLSQFNKEREQDWVTGAFLLTRKGIFDKVNGFDEDYFMYTEEVDYCYRVKKMGLRVFYLPKWKIIHLGGASSTKEFPIISEYKGIKIFYKKNMPNWQFPFLIFFLKAGALLRALIFGLIEGRKAYEIYIKAFKVA